MSSGGVSEAVQVRSERLRCVGHSGVLKIRSVYLSIYFGSFSLLFKKFLTVQRQIHVFLSPTVQGKWQHHKIIIASIHKMAEV